MCVVGVKVSHLGRGVRCSSFGVTPEKGSVLLGFKGHTCGGKCFFEGLGVTPGEGCVLQGFGGHTWGGVWDACCWRL